MMLKRLQFLNGYDDLDSSEGELNFSETETETEDECTTESLTQESSDQTTENDDDESMTANESDSSSSSNEDEDSEASEDSTTSAGTTGTTEPMSITEDKPPPVPKPKANSVKASIRDTLVFREFHNEKLAEILPTTCKLIFDDPDELHNFKLEVSPDEGYWKNGRFLFNINVTEEYNFEPPKVKCLTKIWHPNINEDGAICLSILRSAGIDENCWSPARQLKDVILGINSLFTDLLNFHDPLNTQAAEMFERSPEEFEDQVDLYIRQYAKKENGA